MTIIPLLQKINQFILNPLIGLAFAVAMIVFMFGIFQFIGSDMSDKSREDGKKKILYGLLGMFIMVSAFGLIRIVLGTFGISTQTGIINF